MAELTNEEWLAQTGIFLIWVDSEEGSASEDWNTNYAHGKMFIRSGTRRDVYTKAMEMIEKFAQSDYYGHDDVEPLFAAQVFRCPEDAEFGSDGTVLNPSDVVSVFRNGSIQKVT